MRYINADCKHIGIGAGHIAFSLGKDVVVTASHSNMRQFCEEALFLMDEKVMPDIDAGLIHGASDAEWRSIVERLNEMREICISS